MALAAPGRPSRPDRAALQKYATPALVGAFLADPQHRLVFDPVADRGAAPFPGAAGLTSAAQLRKLYLATHHRHYLVAVELHCDRPGLPSPQRSEVCEAGFVIRRRRASVPAAATTEARRRLRDLAVARARLHAVDRRLAQAARAGRTGSGALGALGERYVTAERDVAGRRAALREWAEAAAWTARWRAGAPGRRSGRPARARSRAARRRPAAPARAGAVGTGGRTARRAHRGDVPALPPGARPVGRPPRRRGPDAVLRRRRDRLVGPGDPPRRPGPTGRTSPGRSARRGSTTPPSTRSAATCAGTTPPARAAGRARLPRTADLERTVRAVPPGRPLDPRGTAHRPVTVRMPSRSELQEAAKLGTGAAASGWAAHRSCNSTRPPGAATRSARSPSRSSPSSPPSCCGCSCRSSCCCWDCGSCWP
ncbi:hypothetical protein ACFQ2B_02725 [Streptomyces stramineus]